MLQREGHVDCVKELVDAGADVNLKNRYQDTALTFAGKIGNADIAEILISAGANVRALDMDKSSALMNAVREGRIDKVKQLVGPGQNVNFIYRCFSFRCFRFPSKLSSLCLEQLGEGE